MERMRHTHIERIISRPPLKMSPEKVLRRADEIYRMAVEQKKQGNPVYIDILRDNIFRWRFVNLYLVDRAKNISRVEMGNKLGEFWSERLK